MAETFIRNICGLECQAYTVKTLIGDIVE